MERDSTSNGDTRKAKCQNWNKIGVLVFLGRLLQMTKFLIPWLKKNYEFLKFFQRI